MHSVVGTPAICSQTFNWEMLGLPTMELQDLEDPFSMEELKRAVFSTAVDKAPGPDGFSGGFFKTSWNVVKEDLLRSMNKFYDLNDPSFGNLNVAHYFLLPKKDQPTEAAHFRPISLIHAFGKLVSKILASRLQPKLDGLI